LCIRAKYIRKGHKTKWLHFEEEAEERKNLPENTVYL